MPNDDELPLFLQDSTTRRNKNSNTRIWAIAGGALILVLVIALNLPQQDVLTVFKGRNGPSSPFDAAMNRTLGFASIFAITTNTTWRVQGMKAAANLTNVDVDFFFPREMPDADVLAFRKDAEKDVEIGRGKALAWLAHLDMLQHIVDNKLETALIIEDDVDWDVYIREQMLQVAKAFGSREAVLQGTKKPGATRGDPKYPYGMDWDLLWIGHNFDDMTGFEEREQFMWHDNTVPPKEKYLGFTPWFDRIPLGHRAL